VVAEHGAGHPGPAPLQAEGPVDVIALDFLALRKVES
jgi:hypothetical protein